MADKFTWHGEEYRRLLEAEFHKRAGAAARLVLNHARKLISISGTGVYEGTRELHRLKKAQASRGRKAKFARRINKLASRYNKVARLVKKKTGINLGRKKTNLRVTKTGKFTRRRKGRRGKR